MTKALLTVSMAAIFAACGTSEIPSIPSPTETPALVAKPPLELVDISKMPPTPPKRMQTSMEDAVGNKNQVLADLIANGKDAIPFLINKLDDETEMDRRSETYWYRLYVGDMALIILSNLFLDDTGTATVEGYGWDEFLERGNDEKVTGEEVLRRYIRKHGRATIKRRWEKLWRENKDKIFWDADRRCFKVSNKPAGNAQ